MCDSSSGQTDLAGPAPPNENNKTFSHLNGIICKPYSDQWFCFQTFITIFFCIFLFSLLWGIKALNGA